MGVCVWVHMYVGVCIHLGGWMGVCVWVHMYVGVCKLPACSEAVSPSLTS